MNDRQLYWAEKEKLRITLIEEDLENLKPDLCEKCKGCCEN